jgi:hypothetical protein
VQLLNYANGLNNLQKKQNSNKLTTLKQFMSYFRSNDSKHTLPSVPSLLVRSQDNSVGDPAEREKTAAQPATNNTFLKSLITFRRNFAAVFFPLLF